LLEVTEAAIDVWGMEASGSDVRHGGKAIPVSVFRPLFQGKLIANQDYDLEKAEEALVRGAQGDLERLRVGGSTGSRVCRSSIQACHTFRYPFVTPFELLVCR
jgi:hypothetical protein